MMTITIRPEREEDREEIFNINYLAFRQNNEAILVDSLRESEAFIQGLSLVADSGTRLSGHILFTKALIEHPEGHHFDTLALAPMAVHPEFQKMGIGSALVREGLRLARQRNLSSVVVLGHKDYYPRFGFLQGKIFGITCPFEVPEEYFMVRELFPGSLTGVSGKVVYSTPFYSI